MATRIRVKRGTSSQITGYTGPHYVGELAYATDTEAFFVSNGTAFIPVGGSSETPTLQSVTDAGNTTTNAISAGTVTANNELHLVNSQMRIFRSSDDMRIRTGNSDRMTITSTGNVGIGTTSPIEKLHVSGNVLATGGTVTAFASNTSKAIISNVSGGGRLQLISDEGDIYLRTKGGDSYFNAGNVGIGTTTPTEKLEVAGNITLSGGDRTINTENNSSITIHSPDVVGFARLRANNNFVQVGPLYSYTPNKFGIGKTNPSYTLDITGTARIEGGDFSVDGNRSIYFGPVGAQGRLRMSGAFAAFSDTGFNWYTNGEVSTPSMLLDSAGNVGIGTTAPLSLLHVNTSYYAPITIGETTDATTKYNNIVSTQYLSTTESEGFSVLNTVASSPYSNLNIGGGKAENNAATQISFFTGATTSTRTGSARMTITKDGNVGIGTTSPTSKLHVVGNSFFQNTISLPDNAYVGLGTTFDFHLVHNGSSSSITNSTGNLNILSNGGDAVFSTASTERMRIGSNGAVAIGSTNTATGYTLYVAGNVGVSGLATTNDITLGENRAIRNLGSTIIDIDSNNDGVSDYFAVTKGGYVASTTLLKVEQDGDVIVPIGNVGIGTATPAQALHINKASPYIQIQDSSAGTRADIDGGIIIKDSTGKQSFGITQSNSADVEIRANAGDLSLGTFAGTVIKLDGSKVGIGTTAPAEKLEVAGNIKLRTGDYLKSSTRTNILLDRPSDARMVFNTLYQSSTTGGYDFTTGSTSRIVITGDGNVGIGTTAPATILHLRGDSPTLRIEADGANESSIIELVQDGGITGAAIKYNGASNIEALQFNTGVSDVRMTIKRTNGNVGIGTIAPAAKLDVVGTIKLDDGGGSVYVGNAAGYNDDKTFNYNVGIGDNALAANTSGNNNIAVGAYALYNPTNVSGNIAIGGGALGDTTTGYRNTAVGHLAHSLNTSGYENVAIGHNALGSATSPYQSVAVGSYALGNANGVASDNTGIGYSAMSLLTTGRYNTSLGTYALSDTVLGSNNTAVGYYAGGGDYQGTNSVYLGMNTAPNSTNETNQVVIGYGATGNGSNSVTIGNTSITKTIMQEGVGVGVTSPTSSMHIDGAAMRQLRINTPGGPTGNGDTTGNIGDIAYDDLYFYIKTINGWGRVPLDFGF